MFKKVWLVGLFTFLGIVSSSSAACASDVFRLGFQSESEVPATRLGQLPKEATAEKTCCFRGFRCGVVAPCCVVTTVTCLPPAIVTIPRLTICAPVCPPVIVTRRVFWSACFPRVVLSTPICSSVTLGSPTITAGPSFSLSTPTTPGVIPGTTPPPMQLPFPRSEPSKSATIPQQPSQTGTFDYDGGPKSPVPMPGLNPIPMKSKPTQALEGIPVSYEISRTAKYRYPAYGEKTETTKPVLRSVSR